MALGEGILYYGGMCFVKIYITDFDGGMRILGLGMDNMGKGLWMGRRKRNVKNYLIENNYFSLFIFSTFFLWMYFKYNCI